MTTKGSIGLLLITTLISINSWAETYRLGVASYQQLSKEYYLAALYTQQPMNNVEQILADNTVKKMVIRVTANRWSEASFLKIWRQDISINNTLSNDLELANAVNRFINFPQETLRKGDEITVRLTQDSNTEVRLNSELVYTQTGKKLFIALLKTWLGEVPPSRLFQSDLLSVEAIVSSHRQTHQENFISLLVAEDRKNLVTQWRANEQRIIQAQLEAEKASLKRQQDADALRQRIAQEKKAQQEKELAATRTKPAVSKPVQTKTNTVATLTPEKKTEATTTDKELQQQLTKLEAEAKLQDYMIALYQWQVAQAVYQKVEYPQWAKDFNLSGTVSIEFLVQANGQLTGVSAITPNDSGLLGQALQSGLTQAAPFNAFSERLKAKELILKVDYEFNLENQVAPTLSEPEAPKNLQELIALVG